MQITKIQDGGCGHLGSRNLQHSLKANANEIQDGDWRYMYFEKLLQMLPYQIWWKSCDCDLKCIAPKDLESLALNITEWHSYCRDSFTQFEADRVSTLKSGRSWRHGQANTVTHLRLPLWHLGVYADNRLNCIGLYWIVLDCIRIVAHNELPRDQWAVEATAQSITMYRHV